MGRRRQGEPENGRAAGEASEQIVSESRTDRLRIRAAWMYFVEQMTENEIADVLGVG
ncbi:sugar-binding transcriptional regulator, partial [Mesorhizobium sp. M2C.T.Ca.TU.002.02.1.1]